MNDELKSARACAIAYIGISNKSSGKVREYLLQKGYSPDISEQTVLTLVEDDYISDKRVASTILRNRSGKKSEGKNLLFKRLLHAGIPEAIAQDILLEMVDDREAVLLYIEANILPSYSDELLSNRELFGKWYQKSMRKLMSKGFSAELSAESLRKSIRDVE